MSIEEEILMRKKLDKDKLIKYGFSISNKSLRYSKNIINDSLRVDILINDKLELSSSIYDVSTDEVYLTYKIESQNGEFVNKVRDEYRKTLEDIVNKCSYNEYFASKQANEILTKIKEIYYSNAEFLWEHNKDTCIFRNSINRKWYALMTKIDRNKLNEDLSGSVDILNIKLNPDEILNLLNKAGFYKAYHMNKKYWITIVLDDTIKSNVIINYIKKSYEITKKK